jgi:hypothetical protein
MMVIYTTRYIPDWAAGCALGPVILIKPAYKADVGLLTHEKTHVGQWWHLTLLALPLAALCYATGRTDLLVYTPLAMCLHPLAYLVSDQYRLWCEVQAYRKQLSHYADDRRMKFAGFIASRYRLKVTTAQAFDLLKE